MIFFLTLFLQLAATLSLKRASYSVCIKNRSVKRLDCLKEYSRLSEPKIRVSALFESAGFDFDQTGTFRKSIFKGFWFVALIESLLFTVSEMSLASQADSVSHYREEHSLMHSHKHLQCILFDNV